MYRAIPVYRPSTDGLIQSLVYRSGSVAKLYRRRPMLRNIGRLHQSTDASNIPFIGEASYDLAISGGRGTQVLQSAQSEPGLTKSSYGHAKSLYR